MNEMGEGMEQDFAKAAYCFRLAAEHVPDLGGTAQARDNLGILCEIAYGVPKDLLSAYMWLSLLDLKNMNHIHIQLEMTPDQISEAQQFATDWKKAPRDPAIY